MDSNVKYIHSHFNGNYTAIAAMISALRREKYIHKDKEFKTRSKDNLELQEADIESKSK